MTLSARRFHRQFERFKAAVLARDGTRFVSFHQGCCDEREGYKQHIYREGRQRLAFQSWRRKDVGTGKIIRAVRSAIEINTGTLRNNLVQWQGKFGPDSCSHKGLVAALSEPRQMVACEEILLNLYQQNGSRKRAFESLALLLGGRYDLLAYLFFLSNWNDWMPISPVKFDRAFALLGLPIKTSRQCSWENYTNYIEALKLVRSALADEGLEGIRLLDAHSFCWMIVDSSISRQPTARQRPARYVEISQAGAASLSSLHSPTESSAPDFEALHARRSMVGRMAEEIALEVERKRLIEQGKHSLADAVRLVSNNHRLGYDITSYEHDGSDRHIEVKAVSHSENGCEFYLTENQRQQARALPNWWLYLVTLGSAPLIQALPGRLLPESALTPVLHSASLSIRH